MEGLHLLLTLTELRLGMPPSLAKTWHMPNKDRGFHESPEKAVVRGGCTPSSSLKTLSFQARHADECKRSG